MGSVEGALDGVDVVGVEVMGLFGQIRFSQDFYNALKHVSCTWRDWVETLDLKQRFASRVGPSI